MTIKFETSKVKTGIDKNVPEKREEKGGYITIKERNIF